MKKIIAGVLALSLVSGFVPFNNNITDKYTVYAQGETTEEAEYTEGTYGVLKYKNYGDYIEISGCDKTAVDVEIPAEIDGVAVTSISHYAFGYSETLNTVTIPASVTSIGFSFVYSALSEINVAEENENFSSIDGVLFSKDKATLIHYPMGNTKEEYIIPNGVTSIADSAFISSSNLTKITLPDSVLEIGNSSFKNCSNLKEINLPNNLKSMGDYAFYCCGKLESIVIPDSITKINEGCFSCCQELSEVTLSNNLASIGYEAFKYCKFKSITIPDCVTNIGGSVFYGCGYLETITVSKNISKIPGFTFFACTNLKSITLPKSVLEIGENAFYFCENLNSITIENLKCEIYDDINTIAVNGSSNFAGTIYGYENSTAQAYAEKYDKKFVSLGEAPIDEPTLPLGDINGDSTVDASDASNVLAVYALVSTGKDSELTAEQIAAADVNKDGSIDASDASLILAYYAYIQTGGTGTLEEYLNS